MEAPPGALGICHPGHIGGWVIPVFGQDEQNWPDGLRKVLYIFGILYCFMGVAVVSDMFCNAVERITSETREKTVNGRVVTEHIWNGTVANLSLMALGSSAPEILLSIVELLQRKMYYGRLGPGTVVGSAAFNLFCIPAICIVCIPNGEHRRINLLGVFVVTSVFSCFAYLWLLIILKYSSPNVIDIWEAIVTFVFFPVLLVSAYAADQGWMPSFLRNRWRKQPVDNCASSAVDCMGSTTSTCASSPTVSERNASQQPTPVLLSARSLSDVSSDQRTLTIAPAPVQNFLALGVGNKPRRSLALGPNLTEEQLAELVIKTKQAHGGDMKDEEMMKAVYQASKRPATRAYYRSKSIRITSSARKSVSFGNLDRVMDSNEEMGDGKTNKIRASMLRSASFATSRDKKGGEELPAITNLLPEEKVKSASEDRRHTVGNWAPLSTPIKPDTTGTFSLEPITSDSMIVEFSLASYAIRKNTKNAIIAVVRRGYVSEECLVDYYTSDGSAKGGEEFQPTSGTLTFKPGELGKTIYVTILSNSADNAFEDCSYFYVYLDNPRSPTREEEDEDYAIELGLNRTSITINDSFVTSESCGVLSFETNKLVVHDDLGDDIDVACKVVRRTGNAGTIRTYWHTEEGTALANTDFVPGSGTLQLENAETSNTVTMKVKSRARLEGPCEFRVILNNPGNPCTPLDIESETDEGVFTTCKICIQRTAESELRLATLQEKLDEQFVEDDDEESRTWIEQFQSVFYANGSREAQKESSWDEMVLHIICFPWKVFFSPIPPPKYFGGWPCFCLALAFIGFVTVMINDLAYLIGCLFEIREITIAITLVALGTSLPDTFVSRSAAIQDAYADASIGNVTGSNSVNVFLGVGISWSMGAIYWRAQGGSEAWKMQMAERPELVELLPEGTFVVVADGMVLNIVVYLSFSLIALLSLYYRRLYCGSELGGEYKSRIMFAALFFLMWILYLVIVISN